MIPGGDKGRGIHWRRSAGEPRAACGAEIDANRSDWRETPELVLCVDCRWAWIVHTLKLHGEVLTAVLHQHEPAPDLTEVEHAADEGSPLAADLLRGIGKRP